MTQANIKTATNKTALGIETTYGSTPSSMYDAVPINKTVEFALDQTEIENMAESVYLYDNKSTVRGFETGTVKFDMYLKPALTALSSSNAPTETYMTQLLTSFFGGNRVHSGSLVQAGASTTSVAVDGGSTRLAKGQWAAFSTTAGLEPAYVVSMSTNTATLVPALTSIPASASVMVNGNTFYPTDANVSSVTIRHRKVDGSGDFQWLANGCLPKTLDIKLEKEGLATATAEFEIGQWTTGSVVAMSTTAVTETQVSPVCVKDCVLILQPVATTTRTHLPLESFSIKLNSGLSFVPDMGGQIEGKVGVMRTGERIFAEATIKFRSDTQLDSWWNAQTTLQMHLMIPKVDATGIKRWIVVSISSGEIVGKPKVSDTDGRLTYEIVLKSKLNVLATSGSDDLSLAPFTLALI